jgi:hypothetical protein
MGKAHGECKDSRYPLLAIRYSLAAALLASVSQMALAQERPASFVDATSVVPGLVADMRYTGAHNFLGRPIAGYEAPRCLLTKAAAAALAEVAGDIAARGLVLKVFDCYRPARAVANFPGRLYLVAFRPFARLDRRSHAGAPGWRRTRHGHAVRLFQSEIVARRGERQQSSQDQPQLACRGDAAPRLSRLR